jgi:hypothetical protein
MDDSKVGSGKWDGITKQLQRNLAGHTASLGRSNTLIDAR